MNNLLSYCGLVDLRISASDKDLPVQPTTNFMFVENVKLNDLELLEAGGTGKSLSEALILGSTNPQYDKILFIDLPVQYMKLQAQNMKRTCCVQKLF